MTKTKYYKKREKREYRDSTWWLIFRVIVLCALLTRLYNVTQPDHVCWDETHFGKMGSWYINRTFFFDVHPPLGKMLIALSGYFTGYDGKFPFTQPGDKFGNASYVGMRVFCATLGATIVPMSYLIVWELTRSITSAFFSALLILCDIGLVTLVQYILLDPLLLCFMMCSVLGAVKISNQNRLKQIFGFSWWAWLFFTGTMLASCVAVKFVGLFVIIFVGLFSIVDLWRDLGDLSKPVTYFVKQLIARALCLIVWPIILYLTIFYIHLQILNKSGNDNALPFSTAFRSHFEDDSRHNISMPVYIAYGSVITITNSIGDFYLHSHLDAYPEEFGPPQQQVTLFTHDDSNNKWRIKKQSDEIVENAEVEFVKDGDLIRLEHVNTGRNLHSHPIPAPITKDCFQVTAYGENGTGDANDIWVIQTDDKSNEGKISVLKSQIRLIHALQVCTLSLTGKQLPHWAYLQLEVGCNPKLRAEWSTWIIEKNLHPKLPNASYSEYAPTFLEMFIESHSLMFKMNSALKPQEDSSSQPWQWPINYKGQFFSGLNSFIYLLGNPIIWWGNLAFLILFLKVFVIRLIKKRRKYSMNCTAPDRELNAAAWFFVGWVLHYFPFWGMGRVLYFHHYFPALIFNSMLTGVILGYILKEITNLIPNPLKSIIKYVLTGSLTMAIVYSFIIFSPLSYGFMPTQLEPNSSMHRLKWLESWEF